MTDLKLVLKNNKYYATTLVATDSFIGEGIDYKDICIVVTDGFPPSVMHLSQEIGRCERTRSLPDNGVSDHFHMISKNLNERLYLNDITIKYGKEKK